MDENTKKKKSMDVARILYKTKVHDLVSRLVKVNIGGDEFSIKMVEEWYGPLIWCMSMENEVDDSNSDTEGEDEQSQAPIDDDAGIFSEGDFSSEQSINELALNVERLDDRDVVGNMNNSEGDLHMDPVGRHEALSNNDGMCG